MKVQTLLKARALLRVEIPVASLDHMQAFYTTALGFTALGSRRKVDPDLAQLLGSQAVHTQRLQRGRQTLDLCEHCPRGAPYPSPRHSNDLNFQHVALVTADIDAAYRRLCRAPHAAISRAGPQTLPGGIVACKFRDPEGHPLELIQFPDPDPETVGGIDHSAISVADAKASIDYYHHMFGLVPIAQQVNAGPAQDGLDGLDGTQVDVVALAPLRPSPHIELLGYRHPPGRAAWRLHPADLAATRLVLLVDDLPVQQGAVTCADGTRAMLLHDPDGHAVLLVDRDCP